MDLKKALEKQLKSDEHKADYRFIHVEALQRLINQESVRKYLRGNGVDPTVEDTDRIVRHSPKLFAILVLCDRGRAIQSYLSKGFCDENFPVYDKTAIPDVGYPRDQESIYVRQWQIPIVLPRSQHLELPKEFIPPFLEQQARTHGHFGWVYKVKLAKGHLENYDSCEYLALKEIRKDDHNEWAIMMREVETLRKRSHKHIVPLLASWRHHSVESEFYMVAKLNLLFPYSRIDLERWLKLSKPPPDWQGVHGKTLKDYVYRSMMSLCDAVAYLHTAIAGLISSHHDLKPANILLFGRDWKIADFGRTHLIRLSEGSDTEGRTGLGTKTYHPPEYWDPSGERAQVRHGRAFDIWALGCICVEFAILGVHGWSSQKLLQFENERKANPEPLNRSLVDNFAHKGETDNSYHNNMNVVRSWMDKLRSSDGSFNLAAVLDMADSMLDTIPSGRLLSWESYLDFNELLNTNNTLQELEEETQGRVQRPNPRRPKGAQNPLQRAASKGNMVRVKWLLRAGWSDYPVDISSVSGIYRKEIIRLLRVAKVLKGIRWRRASRQWRRATDLLERSKMSPTSSEHAREALATYKGLDNTSSTPSFPLRSRTIAHSDLDQDEQGMTRLHRICEQNNYWAIVSFLDRSSQDSLAEIATCADSLGRLPLHYAASNGSEATVQLLLESFSRNSTALVAWPDSEGKTPLHKAAQKNNTSTIPTLVRVHIDRMSYLAVRDSDYLTARELAERNGNQDAVEQLENLETPMP